MIKVLLIEDEIPARQKMKRFIKELELPIDVVAEIDNVTDAVAFLTTHSVELIFSDIELLDGNSFEIFQQVPINCPIIFTTAYDHFWMEAFEANGIAYLLKPFSLDRFQKAWEKYRLLMHQPSATTWLHNLQQLIHKSNETIAYKKRFTINTNHSLYFLASSDIVYFEAEEGVIFAFDKLAKRHLLSVSSLKELEAQLDPNDFFRINRSQIVQKVYIERLERYSKNTLSLRLHGYNTVLQTCQSNTAALREWIEK